ncbi:MAG: response regulator transcription factor [Gemmatimonadota bacterium]|nr:response regulator transcription factor [Gemmatimonadota bacterium]
MGTTREAERLESLSAPTQHRSVDGEQGAPRVLIISDVRLFREGLALGLCARGDVAIVGTAESLASARALLASCSPDIVLLDTGMARATELTRVLLSSDAALKIVGVAVAEESADVVACGEAGMVGYVARDGSIEDVATAIHDVRRGELQCSPRMAAALFKRLASGGRAPSVADASAALTPRELDVIELIDGGLSNKQIGQRLRIGTATVKNHVHNILEKLHVRRRGEAAARVRAIAPPRPILSRHRHSGETRIADPAT